MSEFDIVTADNNLRLIIELCQHVIETLALKVWTVRSSIVTIFGKPSSK